MAAGTNGWDNKLSGSPAGQSPGKVLQRQDTATATHRVLPEGTARLGSSQKLKQAGNSSHRHIHTVPTLLLHLLSCTHHAGDHEGPRWLGLEESKSVLDLTLALPNAFRSSSHLLAHLCALSPHHILALHEIPRMWCLQLCLGDVPGWKGGTCSNTCSIKVDQIGQ